MQRMALGRWRHPSTNVRYVGFLFMGMPVPTSQSFKEGVAPDGRFFYLVSQHVSPDFSAPNGNKLHTLVVGADGRL